MPSPTIHQKKAASSWLFSWMEYLLSLSLSLFLRTIIVQRNFHVPFCLALSPCNFPKAHALYVARTCMHTNIHTYHHHDCESYRRFIHPKNLVSIKLRLSNRACTTLVTIAKAFKDVKAIEIN